MAKKKKITLQLEDTDVVFVEVNQLPHTGAFGVWYDLPTDDLWYYWTGSGFASQGGDRPTHPPVNP